MNLTQSLIKGLKNYDLTLNDIQNNNFRYFGGNEGSHLNYYNLICEKTSLPEYKNKCICGHTIKENCYITNGDIILTLGNCCIKKFLPKEKQGRTCEKCGNPHRNRKYNKCNDCIKKERIYLHINYEDKDEAKKLGAIWDSEKYSWFSPNSTYDELLKKFKK
jgi:hypothetical protein